MSLLGKKKMCSNEGEKDLEYLCLTHPAVYIKPVLLGKLVNLGSECCL